jgi:hypothetical protein
MKKASALFLLITAALLITACHTPAPKKKKESYYQQQLCERLGGETEYVLKDRTRVDCLSDTYAIEVDFARKWAEGIGQSLYYAQMTGRHPAVGLIVNGKKDARYLKRLEVTAEEYGIKIFIIEKEE